MFPPEFKTLPDTHPMLQSVDSTDTLLRRFNPDNREHFITIDEGSIPTKRLAAGAFTGFSNDGCSVSRAEVLATAQIPVGQILQPKYSGIAEAAAGDVRRLSIPDATGESILPFSVVPDPYPEPIPGGVLPAPHEVAHALVQMASLTKADRRIAVGNLARFVFSPSVISDVPPASAVSAPNSSD